MTKTPQQTPYERGFYEGSRGLPVTLYAIQNEQNEYERGRQDGVQARGIYEANNPPTPKIITLSKPIALSVRRAHLPANDPAYSFSIETAIIYTTDNPQPLQTAEKDGMVSVEISAYVPAKATNGTPYELSALGGNQTITFRKALIQSIAPA